MAADTDAPELARKAHPERAHRVELGKAARTALPLEAHAEVHLPENRPDPVALLVEQGETRVQELLPIRYGRMSATPFTFYRGAAAIMAVDLGNGPDTGLNTQICGDAHLANFGVFGSPERRMLFDINDFDETARGPFEWDVKRLAASLEIAGRSNGYGRKERRRIVVDAVREYRESMHEMAAMGNLELWYARIDMDEAMVRIRSQIPAKRVKVAEQMMLKARTRTSAQAVTKLTTVVDGELRLRHQPPLIETIDVLLPDRTREEFTEQMRTMVREYRATLTSDRRHLLEQYEVIDMARKVVGVGSVGTRCWILLLRGIDSGDPLMLQAKEAGPSVIHRAKVVGRRRANNGERVVHGQRLMQAASDIFLGWKRQDGYDGVSRDFYLRQLRDWKLSFPAELMLPQGMTEYAKLCAWTLARAHARAGDRVAMAAYLGRKPTFEEAIADFSVAYADLNEADHALLAEAIASKRLEAVTGL
ncbi:MAG TPA: DUF2252 domain-containing protein [Candidatus Nanopelagicales bacterium]|nr:DUF2252 domain-containing protein [Candidatus Nanopelagicales bacterium]